MTQDKLLGLSLPIWEAGVSDVAEPRRALDYPHRLSGAGVRVTGRWTGRQTC